MKNCWYNGLDLFKMIDSLTVIEEWQKSIIKGEIESMSFLGIPKGHGILIDADKLMIDINTWCDCKEGSCLLKDAPTIIEADKAEGEET